MNPLCLHRLTAAAVTAGTAALIVSCTATGPVEHGKVIDKRSKAPWTEMVTEAVYNCRAVTTRAARSSLVTGKGGGGKKGGKSDDGDGGGGLIGGLFGGGSDSKPAKKPSPSTNDTAPRPSAKPQSPQPQQRRDCTKAGERKVPKLHPGRYELHIKAEDGRTAWKHVTAEVYNRTRKGDTV